MRIIRIQKGKKFQVNIDDTFTGESIIIDNHYISKKLLKKQEYLVLPKVKEIINSNKPMHLISEQ